jgi:gamma-glutamyltranspeptidase/glutathione hydrolase
MNRLFWFFVVAFVAPIARPTPVTVTPVTALHGMVVAAHPQAAEIGVAVLKAGGSAVDAAVATSLALGVAEPYASGLGGKLMLLYYEAASGRTFVVDAMDAAGSFEVATYLKRPEEDRSYGYGSVCVPGLAAGLWAAHQRWGIRSWADDVRPALALARAGFRVLPKTRDFFDEQDKKLHRGDAELARLYLPGGKMPEVGSLLRNEDLARTMELIATHGRDGFYRGAIAERLVAAVRQGGGVFTLEDLAHYEARIVEPVGLDFRGYRLVCPPAPASGPAILLPIMKVLENESFGGGPLRFAPNLDKIGRVWRIVEPKAYQLIGDVPEARFNFEKLIAPDSIRAIRAQAAAPAVPVEKAVWVDEPLYESAMAATTQFIVVDGRGNIVCATQSLSVHFGAGVVPPGTGVVLNDSMSNFSFTEPQNPGYIAPGRRPRSTIAPTIVFRGAKPVFAIGVPGSARIPTALLQALLDRLVLNRPLADAIGDTRFHYIVPFRAGDEEAFEAEDSLPAAETDALHALGWKIAPPEAAGRGRRFGGINAVEFNADGTLTGYADPRRTNVAAGW